MEAANRSHPTVSAFNRLSNEEKRALVEQAAQQLKQKQELAKKRKQEVQGGVSARALEQFKKKRDKEAAELEKQINQIQLTRIVRPRFADVFSRMHRTASLNDSAVANRTLPKVPDPTKGATFQKWLLTLFKSKGPVFPTLLRNMRTRGGMSPYQALEALGTSEGRKKINPCRADESPSSRFIEAHQAVVYVMAQLRAQDHIRTKGLLVTTSTGGGKTVTGLSVLLAFWNKRIAGKPWPVLLVSTNDNQSQNGCAKLAKEAMLYFPDFMDEETGTFPFGRPIIYNGTVPYWQDPAVIQRAGDAICKRLKAGIATLMTAHAARGVKLTNAHKKRTLHTFGELGNDLMTGAISMPLKQVTIVLDEVQYLLAPPSTEQGLREQYAMVRKALLNRRASNDDTWVVGMTATPGETKEDIVSLLNMVMGGNALRTSDTPEAMAKKAMGYSAYAYLLGDSTRFAPVTMRMECSYLRGSYYAEPYLRRVYRAFLEHPHLPPQAHTFLKNMRNQHGEDWGVGNNKFQALPAPSAEALEKQAKQAQWHYAPQRPDSYMKRLRLASLYVPLDKEELRYIQGKRGNQPMQELVVDFKNVRKAGPNTPPMNAMNNNEDADGNLGKFREDDTYIGRSVLPNASTQQRASRPSRGGVLQRTTWRYLLSPKIPQFLKNVYKDLTSKTRARQGVHFVYTTNTDVARLVAYCLRRILRMPQLKDVAAGTVPSGGPYFVMLNTLASEKPLFRDLKTEASAVKRLEQVISSRENAKGDIIKVVIATGKSFKGVDLRNLRYLHLLDPLVNFRDFLQFVGRGPRMCGHKHLPKSQRKVEVVLYRLAYAPGEPCKDASAALADCFVWDESLKRYLVAGGFRSIENTVLYRASVDYLLFKDTLHKDRDALVDTVRNLTCPEVTPMETDENAQTTKHVGGFGDLSEEYKRHSIDKRLRAVQNRYPRFPKVLPRKYAAMKSQDEALARQTYAPTANYLNYKQGLKNRLVPDNELRARYPQAALRMDFEREKKQVRKALHEEWKRPVNVVNENIRA